MSPFLRVATIQGTRVCTRRFRFPADHRSTPLGSHLRHFSSPPSADNGDKDKDGGNRNDEKGSKATMADSPTMPDPLEVSESTAEFLKEMDKSGDGRIKGIQVNPDSIGASILPGNLVEKTYKMSDSVRQVPVDLAHGYFWMVKELDRIDSKPTLSNETMIPEDEADIFPLLTGLKTLSGQDADLPFVLVTEGDEKHANPATCTLVTISFRENGNRLVKSWTEPFLATFGRPVSKPAPHVLNVSIIERMALLPIQWALTAMIRRNLPVEEHNETLLYFGVRKIPDFCDALRMHNLLTGYVFLVDDAGRIRFAGSGKASDEEVVRMIRFAKELSRESKHKSDGNKKSNKRGHSRKRLVL